MTLYQNFIAELENQGFRGDIETTKATTVLYSTDNSIYEVEPDAVIFPKSFQDVELIFDLLRQEKFREVKITARGGGTSTNGQSINNGLIVDYSRYMNKIISIDVDNMLAIVEPGVILDVLNKELEKYNLYFPPNISPSNRATIGGMVNTDACGKGSCVHGRTSDNIYDLSAHFLSVKNVMSARHYSKEVTSKLLPIITAAKNSYSSAHLARTSTGYNVEKSVKDDVVDLNYLISGSEGTLALVSKITVKLKKLPLKKRVVLLRYKNFDAALADAQNVIALAPTAIETVDENVIRLARNDIIWQDVAHLVGDGNDTSINILEFSYDDLVEFENHEKLLVSRLSEQKYLFKNYFIINKKEEIASIWNLRKQGVGLLGAMKGKRRPLPFVEDTIVPPQELAAYITSFRKILQKYDVIYGMFGHVDAGCLHVRPALNMRQQQDRQLIKKISDEVCELLLQHQGILWGEHGKGFRSEYNEKFFNAEVIKSFRQIKEFFDPHDQLNSNKIASAKQELPKVDSITTRGKLDENIAPKIHDEFENILSCNGNALCFNFETNMAMCPSYKATNNRLYSPKGRAMLFRQWVRENANLPSLREDLGYERVEGVTNPFRRGFFGKMSSLTTKLLRISCGGRDPRRFTSRMTEEESSMLYVRDDRGKDFEKEIYDSFAKCLGCKACNTQCPIKVSIPDAKAYFLSLYFTKNFRKLQDYVIGYIEEIVMILGKFPQVTNFILQNFVVKFLASKLLGVVDIPVITSSLATKSLKISCNAFNQKRSSAILSPRMTVYLLREAYVNFYHAKELQATYELLLKLGFNVEFTKIFTNGKALHSKGFLNRFRKVVKRNISYLKTLDGELISVDPSLALTYRDEYHRFNDEEIKVAYFVEFLAQQNFSQKTITAKNYHLILHCSEQTNIAGIDKKWIEIFAKFGVALNVIKTGCCGMSGSFGNEVQNYQDSKIIFEMNWQQVINKLAQDRDNVIMVSGSSCKAQLQRFSDVVVSNPFDELNCLLR